MKFVKTGNNCACVRFNRIQCGEHGELPPAKEEPKHLPFPGQIRIVFEILFLSIKRTYSYFIEGDAPCTVSHVAIHVTEQVL